MTERRALLAGAAAAASAWCIPAAAARHGAPFSAAPPGDLLPQGWQHVPFSKHKRPTRYDIVQADSHTALRARADQSVSFVLHDAAVDLQRTPVIRWRWRIVKTPRGGDIRASSREDAAARIVLLFDGDRTRLSLADRMAMKMARRLSGRDMPYASLMYVASASATLGSHVSNPLTGRVQMVVASKVAAPTGWISVQRNVVADYRIAFGEAPNRLIAYGVMTDSDNTESTAEAWYGDIHFVSRR